MTTLLGPLPCRECKTPVMVVRRPVMIRGHLPGCGARWHEDCAESASTELRETVVIDGAGRLHACTAARAAA